MPNIGPLEIIVVLIVVLIVFGPKRLPELGRSLGRGIRELRGSVSGEGREEEEERPAKPPAIEASAPPSERAEGETVGKKHD